MLLSEPAQTDPDLVGLTLGMADVVGEATLDAQLALQATRIDERSALPDIECPTLIIAAREDALCGVAKHRAMHELVRSSTLAVIESCGHLSPLERSEAVGLYLSGPCSARLDGPSACG
jgi:pimeloyl-ACP methyl ester carboxylesterase